MLPNANDQRRQLIEVMAGRAQQPQSQMIGQSAGTPITQRAPMLAVGSALPTAAPGLAAIALDPMKKMKNINPQGWKQQTPNHGTGTSQAPTSQTSSSQPQGQMPQQPAGDLTPTPSQTPMPEVQPPQMAPAMMPQGMDPSMMQAGGMPDGMGMMGGGGKSFGSSMPVGGMGG